jgi:hypothetical protein
MRQAVTLTAAMVVISSAMQAQFRVPQPERKTPRAVGVLETFPNGSRRLVPVTFYFEKRYYDATFYRATPVPFTLYSETVYEVQQYGKPLGTFTVQSATQSAAPSADQSAAAWFGNGRYKAAPDAAALAKKKAATHRVVLEDSSKPVLHRREGSEGDNPVPHAATSASAEEAEDDPQRPRLHRKEGSGGDSPALAQTPAATGTEAGTPAGSGQTKDSEEDSDRPKLHRKDDSGSAATTPSATSTAKPSATPSGDTGSASDSTSGGAAAGAAELTPSDDPEHPILRRGKPVQEQSGRDLPDFHAAAKPGTAGAAGAARDDGAVTRQVAISDAGPSEPQPLIFVCTEDERRQMEASARELAQAELRRVAAQRGLVLPAPAGAKSAPSKGAASAAKKKAAQAALPELKLEQEQFVPYALDYNNYATVVFSARYVPETAGAQAEAVAGSAGANGPGASAKSWVVTVIAREDEGKLVKLFSAVSDPRELDLYPEVRLVDAVDPDGYGRYGLLFREQKRDGVSWLLGRTTGYELQTVFETAVR